MKSLLRFSGFQGRLILLLSIAFLLFLGTPFIQVANAQFGINASGSTSYPTAKAFTATHGAGGSGSPVIDTSQSKFGGASGSFVAASSQYLSTPSSSDWEFGTGSFTIDTWVYFNTLPTTAGTGMEIMSQLTDLSNYWEFYFWNTAGTYHWILFYETGGVTQWSFTSNNITIASPDNS